LWPTNFENPAPDFSKNRANSRDILGDAHEYLTRHFVTVYLSTFKMCFASRGCHHAG
jgi:hypothetical protein